MRKAHLFRFGFETPAQARLNAQHGYDDEDSNAIWIVCDDPADAYCWGQSIAEAYVAWLFTNVGASGYSWRDTGFAHWIESDPTSLEAATQASLQTVSHGEMPDFGKMT